jgi:hypothetical protein
VTIEEYKTQTEELAANLLATINDVDRSQEDFVGSQADLVDAEGGARQEHPWRYWVWTSDSVFPPDTDVRAQDAAQRMGALLEAEGWTADNPDLIESEGSYEFRRSDSETSSGWYVKIFFKERPAFQRVSITIVRPSTDASDGTTDAAREFEQTASHLEALLDEHDAALAHTMLARSFSRGYKEYVPHYEQWKAVSGEVRDVIRLIRESLEAR